MTNKLKMNFTKYVSLSVLGMIGLSCYILADTYFVANGIGTDGLTALNLAISVYSFIHGTGLMLGIGGATRYSIQRATDNGEGGNQTFTATVKLGLLLGLIYFMIGLFLTEPLAKLLGADSDTLPLTVTYLKTILCFSPFFIMNNILIAFIRNDKGPKTAMIGMLSGSISNIILDYIFIFPFGMGMFGAAFATGLAPIISMIVMSVHFLKNRNQFKLTRKKSKGLWLAICSLGLSALISETASGVVLIVFNLILLDISGNTAVAAYGIIANISLVGISIFTGIGQGIQPLVSKYHGRGNTDNVHKMLRYAIVLSFTLAALIYVIILFFGSSITDLFNRDKEELLKDIAVNGLKIYFAGFFFAGVNIILSAYYSAVEKPQIGFLISILRGLVVIVPSALILSNLLGVNGVWLAFLVTEIFVFAIALIRMLATSLRRKNMV